MINKVNKPVHCKMLTGQAPGILFADCGKVILRHLNVSISLE